VLLAYVCVSAVEYLLIKKIKGYTGIAIKASKASFATSQKGRQAKDDLDWFFKLGF